MTRLSPAVAPELLAALMIGIASLAACAKASTSSPARDVPEGQREIAEIHKARCGNCHVRVEPGTRTRAELETAFTRHRTRVHLTESDWETMVDYLAAAPGR
jgi:hypothetical protein